MRAARENIAAEIARLRVRRRLEDLKQAANTGPITRKIAELSEDTITDVIRDRFTRETERLGLDRVTIAKTRASKGALLHQPKLVGARQSTALARVFSEGERTALGLAAYFTEASVHELGSALILDDPVTSLDHIRRERVANRLVDSAETRQVVVFTHDVAFVANLKDAATRKNVVVAERSASRSRAGERLPGFCADTHPWKAKDVQARIGELRAATWLGSKGSPRSSTTGSTKMRWPAGPGSYRRRGSGSSARRSSDKCWPMGDLRCARRWSGSWHGFPATITWNSMAAMVGRPDGPGVTTRAHW